MRDSGRDRRPPRGVGGIPQRDAGASEEEQREDDPRDQAQDPERVEPVRSDEPLRPLHHADPHGDPDPGQDQRGEHVLEQPQPTRMTDQGEREAGVDRLAERLDDRGQQDEESPEDAGVHHPGQRPLEELALTEHLPGLPRHAATHVTVPVDRPSEVDHPGQQPRPPSEEGARDREGQQQDDGSSDHRPESTPEGGMPAATSKLLVAYAGSILR